MNTIDINEQNIDERSPALLKLLLKDKTTELNIRWATDNYKQYGCDYAAECQIKPELIIGSHMKVIQPRVSKDLVEQSKRTRDKAEVFTPSWICNEQNNLVDEAWFGRKDVFNYITDNGWITNEEIIVFPEGKTWKLYVDARRLEVSCGEAPYLVSRYDTVSGKFISVKERIGLLDRKLRVVNENTDNKDDWYKWTIRAYQSTYGYEFQGDNILLARENLLYTFIDNMLYKFGHEPTLEQIKNIAIIVSWNIWQMDGLTLSAPYSEEKPAFIQISLFDIEEEKGSPIPCKIFNWRANYSLEFRSMVNGG
ncbi:hypothetical protein [Sporosarcina ureae]|uniref:hypothetical protein n=1 Tax=Sporosarcina ureae TaxID=1571 RepID=UPI0028AF9610|nr:hypothetical protein [Sporosarcina ureae]